MRLKILQTNDMHGTLTEERFQQLKALRREADVYFDCGDAVKTGNVGIPVRPEAVWPLLSQLDCTASVPGNRESHFLAPVFESKLAGATHPILCGNLHLKDGTYPLPRTLIHESQGIRVGILAVMVPMVTERMKTKAISAYLWDQPVPVACGLAEELRPQVDLVIALTHIGHRADVQLAEMGVVDIILGGHSHTILESPEKVGGSWICQGGSHNRFAGLYEWDGTTLTGGLHPLR